MPDMATHAQFGHLVQAQLPTEIAQQLAIRQDLFVMGLQGPDLLFHYKPTTKNQISQLGGDLHERAAYDFFAQAADLSPEAPFSMAQLAYLLGCCCHYALDRTVHPYVNDVSAGSTTVHYSLEADLDLAIVTQYHLPRARVHCLPKQVECAPIAACYGLAIPVVERCFQTMRRDAKVLAHRKLVGMGERLLGKHDHFVNLCLKDEIVHANEVSTLLLLFEQSVALAISLVNTVYQVARTQDCSLLEDFQHNFEGECVADLY